MFARTEITERVVSPHTDVLFVHKYANPLDTCLHF